MSDREQIEQALRKATRAVLGARSELEKVQSRHHAPLAIVGVGLRLPGGATDLGSLWEVLASGTDTLRAISPQRFDLADAYSPDPERAGSTYVQHASLLDDVAGFDATMFGIPPREALPMDPQHRLLLEATWTALEDAGFDARSLKDSATGVFVGIGPNEYARYRGRTAERADAYDLTGSLVAFAAGRLAYHLGLQGPALSVDTACSSSLVALHLASEHLRAGRCDVALAGGVQVLVDPETFVLLSRTRALSADGRCKTFSANADGYGRGEGVGVLALMRLEDARAQGRRVLGVIRGTAVNHDGASSGITAPNGTSQQKVLRGALENARLQPEDVDFIECHGTGTALGDPIEVLALDAVYGQARAKEAGPLRLGAVKTNLGHLESAAGITGVLKVLASFQHSALPPSLRCTPPNPHLDWPRLRVQVVDSLTPWPRQAERPRRAGVSAFGLSGTNAHVILEEAPPVEESPPSPSRSAELVVLSAKTEEALRATTDRLRRHLEAHPEQSLGDVAYSLVATRSALEHRLSLPVATRGALLKVLEVASAGETPPGASRGEVSESGGKLAWLFSGQGSQTPGMGRELYESWPVFRAALESAWSVLDAHLERPLREVMWAEAGSAESRLLEQTAYTQPALFALQWALASLWRSWGVEPELLCGHSVGELAAACVAGVMTLPDAGRLVCARGRLMQALPAGGAMVSIEAAEAEVGAAVAGCAGTVSIAAINGPSSVVISGEEGATLSIAEGFSSRGIRTKRLSTSHAFHSPLMEPAVANFRQIAESIAYAPPSMAMVSTVSGAVVGGEIATSRYWVNHVLAPVRFWAAVEALRIEGGGTFVEIGPKGTLLGLVSELGWAGEVLLLPSLRSGRCESEAALGALGGWFARGGRVSWDAVLAPGARRVPLPTYPWQRQRVWLESSSPRATGGTATSHPLLGMRVGSAGDALYETLLSPKEPSWLGDHLVGDRVVVPGAAVAELVRAAGEEHGGGAPCQVSGLVFQVPLTIPESGSQRVQVVLSESGTRASVYSQPAAATGSLTWTLHATGELSPVPAAAARVLDLESLRRRCTEPMDVAAIYASFASVGLVLGPSFHGIRALWRGKNEALGEVSLDPGVTVDGYGLHPALLDAALQSIPGAVGSDSSGGGLLPFEMGRVVVHRSGATSAVVHVRVVEKTPAGAVADVTLTDGSGSVVAHVERVRARRVDLGSLHAQSAHASDALHRLDWRPVESMGAEGVLTGRWAVVAWGEGSRAQSVLEELRARGASAEVVSIAQLGGSLALVDHVLCAWGDGADASAALSMSVAGLSVAQALLPRTSAARLWWVTRGSISVSGESLSPSASSVWGLGRTLMQEHPELRCTLLDVESSGSLSEALAREVSAGDDETQVAWRANERHVARLVRAVSPASSVVRSLRVEGTVLVTGGLGALGLQVARGLARRGVKHLLLTGRRGLATPGAPAAVLELEGLGAQVTVSALDVSDEEALKQLLSQVPAELPLRGVVHAAGVVDDGVLRDQTAERFARVMRPKAEGAWNLHELTADVDLDLFVLFSSVAGTLGSSGQSSYTAANAYLDGLAAYRRTRGLAGVSLAWGPWAEGGMAASLDASLLARLGRQGLGTISMSQGLQLFDQALSRPESQLVLAPIDLAAAAAALGAWVPPVWRALVRAPSARAAAAKGSWALEVASLPVDKRAGAVTQAVRLEVARVLGHADAVAEDRAFTELGLDSLMAVELRNALGRRAGATLPATLAFDHPTPQAIAKYLLDEVLSTREVSTTLASPVTALADEPIAIVGMGCRLPGGVTDPESFWRLLSDGVDAVTEVPAERWDIEHWYDADPDAAGKMTTRWGGFVEGLELLDPTFFGLSPLEAPSVDPQERMLLETAWEALERAGLTPAALMGSDTGVYMGLCGTEYQMRAIADARRIDAYSLLGTVHSAMVGRLSYWLGLKGPNLPVDTACSSSLVAVHLACQALRAGECRLALAGGANVLLDPEATVYFSRLRALSPTGRCHSFSSDADGYVRAEGAGVVVLERLSDAQRNGHPVLAVIRGTAVNQDGRSNGLTAPNGPAQQAVIRQALARAGVKPSQVGYVECHGTGTSLGDPIEVQALGDVLGEGRDSADPVVIGSLKTNVGHMEGAAGVGGLMKAVLCLQQGRIPKSLHFASPNPHIAWSDLRVKVASEALDWPRNGTPRIAGVSSFGFSGTNAHIVLEEAPLLADATSAPSRSAELVVLSARTERALRATADRLRKHLESHPEQSLGDVAYSLVTARSAMEHRLTLSAPTRDALLEALEAVSAGATPSGAARGEASESAGKLAWLFSGQGSQSLGMGRELYGAWPVFRDALESAWSALDAHLERPLREVMWAEAGTVEAALLEQTAYTQPALFALQWALSTLWRSWGLEPDLLCGHSVGEVAAACVAGVMSLQDAARLVCARGRLMQALPAGGAMVSIEASEVEVVEALMGSTHRASVAAVNGPRSVVVSGDESTVEAIASSFASRGIRTHRLKVSHAFHSPRMDPMLGEFGRVAESIAYRPATRGLVSNVSGALAGSEVSTAGYWMRHAREAVRFGDGVEALRAAGVETYLELGPNSTLLGLVRGCLGDVVAQLLPSLRAGRSESVTALDALGGWFARGGRVSWTAVLAPAARRVPLPTYPWQRERYWIESSSARTKDGSATGHPLLGMRIGSAGEALYETLLSAREPSWLGDHRVGGAVVVAGAAVAELMRAAGEDHGGGAPCQVTGLVLQVPLVVPESGAQRVQVVLSEGGTRVSVCSQPAIASGSLTWTLHATGTLGAAPAIAPRAEELASIRRRCSEPMDVAAAYEAFASLGLQYGPSFQAIRALWRGKDEALAEVSLDSGVAVDGYGLHPTLLDAALQSILGVVASSSLGVAMLPFELGRVVLHRSGATSAVVHVRLLEAASADGVVADITLMDESGAVIARAERVRARRVELGSLSAQDEHASDALYRLDWQGVDFAGAAGAPTGRWAVVEWGDGSGEQSVLEELRARGASVERVPIAQLGAGISADHVLCVWGESAEASAALGMSVQGLWVSQALVSSKSSARLWWVTRGAISVSGELVSPSASSVWGLGRTLMQEHPELRCTLLDVESSGSISEALARELAAGDEETQVAWRANRRHVARLVRAGARAPNGTRGLRTEGTVLVTGGLGALGLQVARGLARRGVKHLVLTGRRGLVTPGASEAVLELEGLGARVTVSAFDVSDRSALSQLLSQLPAELPLRGVVHAAGVLDDGVLSEQTAERFERVMRPKTDGAWNLHELTEGLDLDVFVLFSSVAGTLGSAGQSGYTAANAYLDGLAAHRQARGLAGLSLAWGVWGGGGLAASLDANLQARLARQGLGLISMNQGSELFDQALARSEAQLVLAPIDLRTAARALAAWVPPLWRALVRAPGVRAAAAKGTWGREVAALPVDKRAEAVTQAVRAEVARVLGLGRGAGAVAADIPFKELGLDSLTAVELRNALGRRAGVSLPATLAFDHPTPSAVAKYLLAEVLSIGDVTTTPSNHTSTSADEPIAIVGMGCRYPGGVIDPETFWRLLSEGVDAVTEVPAERWDIDALYDPDPEATGKMTTRFGGFVLGVDRFDPEFFGISPREAQKLDPQQRLLLETTWEALERAGLSPDAMMSSDTGVFVGLMYQDYLQLVGTRGGLEALDGYAGTGSAGSVASGRISYLLGVRGPSITLDTACSSSLVTLHLACQSLRQGECSVALAGGVALMQTPTTFVEFSRLRGLAPDGRCKSFSAAADGVGWSEGCGMLVLERLSDARRNGHPVLALIRGTAVNQDGRSNGLTAPNGPAQQAVIRQALRRAQVAPSQVDYVECHGTGTSLGDPIEVQALGAVYGEGRDSAHPVVIGSVKTNFGHTQAAAGVAGVIKVALSLQHDRIPQHLHFAAPSPHIAWNELSVKVASEALDWPRNGRPRIAGVSSFGISGTNAHVILEEAPAVTDSPSSAPRIAELIVLSAKTEGALRATAVKLREHLQNHQQQSLGDVAYSLVTTRSSMEHRLAMAVPTREALVLALEVASQGEIPTGASRGNASDSGGKLAWLFSGQGSQMAGMGRELYGSWPVFQAALDAAWSVLDVHLERPLRDVMWAEAGSAESGLLEQTAYTQPALFALQWALSALWQSFGLEPELLCGHSVGELAAACVAGVMSLADAGRLVCARGRLMQMLPPGGAMVSVEAAEAEVAAAMAEHADRVSLAAVNGPRSVVISGDESTVESIASNFANRGIRTQRLKVSHAFHSPRMDPMLEEFGRVARSITYRPATRALVSSVRGALAESEVSTAGYWVRHAREAVRFGDGVEALQAAGAGSYLELGPKSTLLGLVRGCLGEAAVQLFPSLRSGRSESEAVLEALGGWFAGGGRVSWDAVLAPGARRLALPTYPWQRERYWVESSGGHATGGRATGHPLLGMRIGSAGEALYETLLSASEPSWLGDHRVGDLIVVAGAAVAELVRAAGEDHGGGAPCQVTGLVLQAPLVVAESGLQRVQVVLSEGGTRASVYSQPAGAAGSLTWTLHAAGDLGPAPAVARVQDLQSLRRRCAEPTDVAAMYAAFASMGLAYGRAFQGMRALWRGKDEALGELALDPGVTADGYGLHPALLDAALQTILGALGAEPSSDAMLPFEMGRVAVHRSAATSAVVHARITDRSADGAVADVTLMDASGVVVAQVERVRVRRAELGSLRTQDTQASSAMYRLDWQGVESAESAGTFAGRWTVVAWGEGSQAQSVLEELRARGASAEVMSIAQLASAAPVDHVLCVWAEGADASAALAMSVAGLSVSQALVSTKSSARLWWVTRGSMSVSGEPLSPSASSVWGLGRTLMQEHPELRCTLLDVESSGSVSEALVRELSAGDDETQVAWRGPHRFVARLAQARTIPSFPANGNYELRTRRTGTLDALTLVASSRRAPNAGEVEIEVAWSGLNFRDVLMALGMYPGEVGALGGECSGVICGVGEGVSGWSLGDEVMALAPGAMGRYATVDARLVSRVPKGLTLQEASTVPVVFLTAWYALHDLGNLQRGERLLVHAAAGGVGMAAVQLAQWIGAEVLATASTGKQEVVRSLGVSRIANSRDLSFVEAFRSTSSGAPVVDVVLNSLAGEFVDASLSLLSLGGRFLEMGKTDIRDASMISASHPGVMYRAFDIVEAGPDRIASMFAQLVEGFESGHLHALPVRSFSLTEAEAAFRFMAQARHVGKLALCAIRAPLRTEGTVLVTGGLGALGLHVARGLAAQGVKHLVLTGRRGLATPGASSAVMELEGLGARVTVLALDASDRDALKALLLQLPPELPLRGVVHAAGVLDDGILSEQTADRFARVMRPKAEGAWNLHELTEGLDLDLFVLFSSVAGTLGSAGQSSYTAANGYLDGLASYRRARGLVGVSLAWGAWAEGGMAAGLDAGLLARLARQGLGTISASRGLELFDRAVSRPEAQLVLAPIDLRLAAKALGAWVPPLWRALVRAPSARAAAAAKGTWAHELASLPVDKRAESVLQAVRLEVARVLGLGHGTDAVAEDTAFTELGLDSLMAVELRNGLGRRAGVTLSATLAFDHPTPAAIAKYLLAEVLSTSEASTAPASPISVSLDEPIAIVGMGCRLPGGVTDPDSFWRLLSDGVDAVVEVPAERWDIERWYDADPDAAGKMTTRWGGFVEGLEQLDPTFFGLSPLEAPSVDPQERMLLETAWEALERAGLTPAALMGSDTGVYMGLCGTEYQMRAIADARRIDAYSLLGTAHSAMVGRLSYWLGLKGPNMPVDTACSSSLVAVHLACQALRTGECRLALAGGANVLLDPEATVYFSRLRALSPTGRCHSFSSDADGYVRAEGAGVVVLERLSDAQRNGHPVLAIIRGTAVNQDGRSNGLTAPNGPAQQAVIRQALARAGVKPSQVGYVECHGTGTPLGDPIEVHALGAVLGEGRDSAHPVVIGTLKSNVGHMEGAAGIGGLMKAVLCLQQGRIPKSLHFASPNPQIAWDELPVKVASEGLDWPRNGKPRVAGVSSFGFSGTNAHAILEEAPALAGHPPTAPRPVELVVLSARTPAALDATAGRLRAYLEAHPELPLGDVAYSLVTTRSAMEHRLALSVPSRESLLGMLWVASGGGTPPGAARGVAAKSAGKLAWLFSGQGSQIAGMGRDLHGTWRVFREALESVWSELDPHLERPLREVMWAEPGSAEAGLLEQTGYAQPALFSMEWALSALWRSWGVEPDLLCGHSVGEVAAACVAEVMTLSDAARLVCARGRLMQALPAGGAMVSVEASEAEVAAALEPHASRVSVAAVNGPRSIVLSGDESSVEAITSGFARRGIRTQRLTVSHAFHSARMDPMLGEFARVAESITYRPATRALVSNLSGALAGSEVSTPGYWVRHAREAVRFGQGVEALRIAGAESYLEIGPKSTLVGLVRGCVGEAPVHLLSSLRTSLRPGRTESGAVVEALGEWFTRGGHVDWDAVLASGAHRVPLPTYPWQRERYWIESSAPRTGGGTATSHPLLGERIAFAGADAAYETSLSAKEPLWLGAAVELMRAAAEDHECGVPCQVTGFMLQAPMVASDSGSRRVQVVLSEGGTRAKMYSQPASATGSSTWTLHAIGEIRPAPATAARQEDLESIRSRCIEPVDVESTAAALASAGIVFAPATRALRGLWRGPNEALGELSLDSRVSVDGYGLHPALLDAALQSVLGAIEANTKGGVMLPYELGRVVVHRSGTTSAVVHVRLLEAPSPDDAVARVTLMDESGAVIARVDRVRVRAPQRESLRPRDRQAPGVMYRLAWQEVESAESAGALSGHWAVVARNDGTPEQALLEALRARGASAESVSIARLGEGISADHVLSVWDEGADAKAALDMAVAGLSMSHALVSSKSSARLWWVTRASQSVSAEPLSPSASSVWGLGRTLMQEYPELRCTLLDVEPSGSISEALARELTACDEETQVTWRGDRRHVARLVRAAPAAPSSTRSLRVDGTVLVTGGLGALGLLVARGLAERGVSHLVLTGRRGLETPGAPAAVAELESLGARVTVSAMDVSDRMELSQLLSQVPPELPLRGVVHAAGVVEDGLLSEQTAERFARVIRPKAEGAWNLHELTARMDLDLFVLFSSASGTLGSAGQSGYTAANAYLDGLAAYRRARGLAGLSLAWGAWAERGMAAALSTSLQARLGRQGLGLISARDGLALFDHAITRPEAQLVLTPIDLRVAARAFGAWVPPLWRVLVRAGATAASGGWVREIAALPVDGRAEAVTHAVRVEVARVLGLADAGAVAQDKTFKDLGMDSLMGVELRNALGRRAGVSLPVTLAFDHPSPMAIAGYLLAEVFSRRSPSGLPAKRLSTNPEPVQHSLSSRDGLTIYGHLSLPPGPGPFPAIVVHTADPGGALGVDGRYAKVSEHAPLVAAGFAVFTVDQRGAPGHGDEYTRRNEVGGADVDDLVAAADYLAQRSEVDSERLGIFGTSRGAYASFLAVQRAPHRWRAAALNMGFYDALDLAHYRREIGAETSGINALGFHSWDDAIRHWSTREPQGLGAIGRVAVPLFAIHGDADRIVPIEQALKLQDAARAAGVSFSLEVVPQMGHDFEQIHSAWPAIWVKVCAFFAKHLDRGGRPDHSAGSNGVGTHPPLHAIDVSGEI